MKYYFKYPRFNDVFSRNNLPKVKDGAYITNFDDKNIKGTRWVSLFIDINLAVYIDSYGIEYISLEVLSKSRDKSITHNIFRIQDNESIKCGFSCITLVENMLPGRTLLNFHQMTIKRTTK